MSLISETKAAYDEAVAEYKKIETAISHLITIKGILSNASLSFSMAKRQINICWDATTNANIEIDSFNKYLDMIQENKTTIEETDKKINEYIGDIENAIKKADVALEVAHGKVESTHQKYQDALCIESGQYHKG